jgi:hypothetical protein
MYDAALVEAASLGASPSRESYLETAQKGANSPSAGAQAAKKNNKDSMLGELADFF